jgi:hypothetical protein
MEQEVEGLLELEDLDLASGGAEQSAADLLRADRSPPQAARGRAAQGDRPRAQGM